MADSKQSVFYNERFSFLDPSSNTSCSRSTRCRYKRSRRNAVEPQDLSIQEETEYSGLDINIDNQHEMLTDNPYENDHEPYEPLSIDNKRGSDPLDKPYDSDGDWANEEEVASEQEALIQTGGLSEAPI